jgi:hypothetical protein
MLKPGYGYSRTCARLHMIEKVFPDDMLKCLEIFNDLGIIFFNKNY